MNKPLLQRQFPAIIWLKNFLVAGFIAGITGCFFEDEADLSITEGADLFDETGLLTYEITLADEDWATLSYEGKKLSVLAGGCKRFSEYTQFRGRVDVDNTTLQDVQIRKKGSLGSLSSSRPSLKLDFGSGDINDDRTFRGERHVTLNNNHQSPALIEQCLSYYVFNKAGINAPKCNFARVVAQGVSKGIYTHVEDIKKPFLERTFGEKNGNLYEGNESDFTNALVARFEKKATNDISDISDLNAVVELIENGSTDLYNALDQYIDMDKFITFAAVEALVGHYDSYTGGQSNFYVYHNPVDDKFHFIPWGTDQTFKDRLGSGYPESVFLGNHLMYNLWPLADFRQRYDIRMQELLTDVWDETELKSLADQYAALTEANSGFTQDVKDFIDGQRAKITAELGDDSRSWPKDVRNEVPVSDTPECKTLEDITGEFEGTTNGYQVADFDAEFTFDYRIPGESVTLVAEPGAFLSNLWAGEDSSLTEQFMSVGKISFSKNMDDGDVFWITLVMPLDVFKPGEHPLHAFDTFGVYGSNNLGFLGFIGDGMINLEEASLTNGSNLKGTLSGKLIPQ